MSRAAVVICLFALAVVFAFWPALKGPLLFDSVPAISANPDLNLPDHLLDGWYAAAFSSNSGPGGRPVAMLSFALNSGLTGSDGVLAFRLTNLTIHTLNAVLVAVLVSRFMRRLIKGSRHFQRLATPVWVGILAGAIFLLHTLQLTAVLHDVQRMVLLATMFQLMAVLVYLRGRELWAGRGVGWVRACNDLTLIAFLCVLGFLSKENALLTPFLLVVVEAFWFSSRPKTVLLFAFAIPGSLLVAWLFLGGMDGLREMYSGRNFDLADRLFTQPRVLWIYLYWFFVPASLTAGWNHDDITISRAVTDPLVVAALVGWAVALTLMYLSVGQRRGLKLVGFAIAWFLISHLMESTVVPLEMVFEHRNYGAIVGLTMAVSFLLLRLADKLPSSLAPAVPVLVVLMLWGLLFVRAQAWENPLTLGVFSVAERPESARSKSDLAEATFNRALKTDDRNLAISARDLFWQLADAAPTDALPLARLIEVESILGDRERLDQAVTRLATALTKPRLSVQDWIGLSLVEQCAVARQCIVPAATERILSTLASRPDADPAALTLTRARIALGASGNARDAIDRLRIGPPLSSYSPVQLIEIAIWHGVAGERAPALEMIRLAIAADRMRLRTAAIRRLYAAPTAG